MTVQDVIENQSEEAAKVFIRNLLRFPPSLIGQINSEEITRRLESGEEHLRFDFDARDFSICPSDRNKSVLSSIQKAWFYRPTIEVYSRKGSIEIIFIDDIIGPKKFRVYDGNGSGTVEICLGISRIVHGISGEKYMQEIENTKSCYSSSERVRELLEKGFTFGLS